MLSKFEIGGYNFWLQNSHLYGVKSQYIYYLDGGWLHHFIYEDYRYNRHKVFASGRAQFKCRHKGCKANMIVK